MKSAGWERGREEARAGSDEGAKARGGHGGRGGISCDSAVVVVETSEEAANVVTIVSVGYGFSTDGLFDIILAYG